MDKTLKALEAITATLGETANKLRDETANSTAAAAAALTSGKSPQPPSDGSGDSSTTTTAKEQASVAQAEAASEQALQQLAASNEKKRDATTDVAAALQQAQQVSNKTLQLVKQSKEALDEAQKANRGQVSNPGLFILKLPSFCRSVHDFHRTGRPGTPEPCPVLSTRPLCLQKHEAVDKAVKQAMDATAIAAAQVNETITALNKLGSQKTSELVNLVSKLAAEEETEEQAELQREHFDRFVAGRKEAIGLGEEASSTAAKSQQAAGSGSGFGSTGDATKARDALKEIKQASASNASMVNVTRMAATVEEVAKSKVESSKQSVEKSIETKKSEVREKEGMWARTPLTANCLALTRKSAHPCPVCRWR